MIPLGHNETRLREVIRAVNQLIRGLSNAKGSVTLRAGETTTIVTHENIAPDSAPVLTAGPGTWSSLALRVSAVAAGSFTITHASEAASDRVVHWHL